MFNILTDRQPATRLGALGLPRLASIVVIHSNERFSTVGREKERGGGGGGSHMDLLKAPVTVWPAARDHGQDSWRNPGLSWRFSEASSLADVQPRPRVYVRKRAVCACV